MKKTYITPNLSFVNLHMEQQLLTITGETYRTNTADFKGTGEDYIGVDNSPSGGFQQDAKGAGIDWDF